MGLTNLISPQEVVQAWSESDQADFMIQMLEARDKLEFISECLIERHWDVDMLRRIHVDMMTTISMLVRSATLIKKSYPITKSEAEDLCSICTGKTASHC